METSLHSAFIIRTVDFAHITVEAAKSLRFEKADRLGSYMSKPLTQNFTTF